MTLRDELVTQVEQAITVAAKVAPNDYEAMAAAAVDAAAILVYTQLLANERP